MAKKATFEGKMDMIEQLLEKMQNPNTGLEEAVVLYEQTTALIDECNATLHNAQLKIEEISKKHLLESDAGENDE